MSGWMLVETDDIHVVPVDDVVAHEDSSDCVCGPYVEYKDPSTGDFYDGGPIVVHHSLDGREANE